MRISNKFFFFIFFSILILIPIGSFPLDVSANETTQYISATDILKNFKFESISGEPIVDEGAFNNKLRFDTQSAWLLYKDDVTLLNKYEVGDSTQLKYRVVLRNKINMYTNVRLNQMSQQMVERQSEFLGCYYRHNALGGSIDDQWWAYIEWDYWDFGDSIYNYNWDNNYFNGRVKMSFDIDDNPIPNSIGDNTETEYGYIAVSEAGIVNNIYGKMSDDMPEIVVLSPSEYESETKDDTTYTPGSTADDDYYQEIINPNINLIVSETPIQSFDASILPDTAGSSMNPENKNGEPIWDPEDEESMTGCNIYYDINSISPIVYRFGGTLTYTEHDLETEDYFIWTINVFGIEVKTNHYYSWNRIEYRDVALHGINRFIQTDMMVAFEIWTSLKLGTLTEQYETLKLYYPEEYYDELIWCTLAGGWTGSTIEEYGQEWFDIKWLDDIFDFFGGVGGIITLIMVIAIAGVGIYVFFVFKRKLKSK